MSSRGRRRGCTITVVLALGLSGAAGVFAATPASAAAADIVFDGSPGTDAPPPTLGGYSMTSVPADSQDTGTSVTSVATPVGPITFSYPLDHELATDGWQTWSNGYEGDVYESDDSDEITLSLPFETKAFYLYAEPNDFEDFDVTAATSDGTSSGPQTIYGDSGAAYFGFYSTGADMISSITISGDGDQIAIGEFGIYQYVAPPPVVTPPTPPAPYVNPCKPVHGSVGTRLLAALKCTGAETLRETQCAAEIVWTVANPFKKIAEAKKTAKGLIDLRKVSKGEKPIAKLFNDLSVAKYSKKAPKGYQSFGQVWEKLEHARSAKDFMTMFPDLKKAFTGAEFTRLAEDIADLADVGGCVKALELAVS